MAKRKRKKTEEEEVIEFLELNGAIEITEEDLKNDPFLRKSSEDFDRNCQEHLKEEKSRKKQIDY